MSAVYLGIAGSETFSALAFGDDGEEPAVEPHLRVSMCHAGRGPSGAPYWGALGEFTAAQLEDHRGLAESTLLRALNSSNPDADLVDELAQVLETARPLLIGPADAL